MKKGGEKGAGYQKPSLYLGIKKIEHLAGKKPLENTKKLLREGARGAEKLSQGARFKKRIIIEVRKYLKILAL